MSRYSQFKSAVRAALPEGITYDADRARYFFSGRRFPTFMRAFRYHNLLSALNLTSKLSSGEFTPASLFASGEEGIWVEATDADTVFLDIAGSALASVDGRVGLVLNKAKGVALGANLIPDMDAALVGRNANSALSAPSDTSITVTSNAGGTFGLNSAPALSAVTGRSYVMAGTFTSSRSIALTTSIGGRNVVFTLLAGVPTAITRYYPDVPTAAAFDLFSSALAAGEVVTVENLTIRELPATPAYQGTPASRPTLREAAGLRYLEDNGVSLNWRAPAGTYTVVYVDNAGNVTTLTGQALNGVTDVLRVLNLVAYVAIDRALTEAEGASLTAYLQAQAGA